LSELFLIVLFPTLCVFVKARSLFREYVRQRVNDSIQSRKASLSGRRRRSMYDNDVQRSMAKRQQDAIPRWAKLAISGFNTLYGMFLISIIIAQIAALFSLETLCGTTEDVTSLWEGCKVKTPLCGKIFSPQCDCAVIIMTNHNMTRLPDEFEEMTALKKVQINNGPLASLPETIGRKLGRLSSLELRFNRLTSLPDSLGALESLVYLFASFNYISDVPKSIWEQDGIMQLDLSTNQLEYIPAHIHMKSLIVLSISNNSISILPPAIGKSSYLNVLECDGNQLTQLPAEISDLRNLEWISVSRNNLTDASFPKDLSALKRLVTFDLRNNSISTLPGWFGDLESLDRLFLADNPLCQNGWLSVVDGRIKALVHMKGAGCARQCSSMCLNDQAFESTLCWPQCNHIDCCYNGGACGIVADGCAAKN
jgi:hypothetical protein